MLYRIIYKKNVISVLLSSFMLFFTSAIADRNHQGYSLLLAGGGNPWAIPETRENYPNYRQPSVYGNQQPRREPEARRNQRQAPQSRIYQGNQFVTDEFLDSLKQQQSQYQVLPEHGRTSHGVRRRSVPEQPNTSLSNPGTYDYPSYGTGYVEPLVDTMSDVPVVTPWTPWDIGVSDW